MSPETSGFHHLSMGRVGGEPFWHHIGYRQCHKDKKGFEFREVP